MNACSKRSSGRRSLARAWLGCLLTVTTLQTGAAQDQTKSSLVEEARTGNQQSLSAIGSMRATITFTILAGKSQSVQIADYWRCPTSVRLQEKNEAGQVVLDVLSTKGLQKALRNISMPGSNARHVTATIAGDDQLITTMDVWSAALCYVPHYRCSLSDLVERGQRIDRAKVVSASGKRQVQLDFEGNNQVKYRIRLDPAANYLIGSAETDCVRQDGDVKTPVHREYAVDAFSEPEPGVFFPLNVTTKNYESGKLIATYKVNFSAVELNPRFSADAFDLKFPAGVVVTDQVRGTVYQLDADERPVGPEKKYLMVPTIAPSEATIETAGARAFNPLLIASAGLIILGGALMLRSRAKKRLA